MRIRRIDAQAARLIGVAPEATVLFMQAVARAGRDACIYYQEFYIPRPAGRCSCPNNGPRSTGAEPGAPPHCRQSPETGGDKHDIEARPTHRFPHQGRRDRRPGRGQRRQPGSRSAQAAEDQLRRADGRLLHPVRRQGPRPVRETWPGAQLLLVRLGRPLLAGLKSESLDVFITGLASAFALGQNLPVKLLFWQLDDAPGQGLVVSKDSGIDSYRDLKKAKAIGTPSGTCAQVALGLMARKAGIAMKELNVVNIAPPLYANAFTSNSIDAGVTWAPYLQSVAERGYKIVNYDTDYDGICPVMTGARASSCRSTPTSA